MAFGLGKQEQKPREPFEKKVFDDFDGVITDAAWLPNNQYNSGPQLKLTIVNVVPSEKVMRSFFKMGKTVENYQISEDGLLFSTDSDLNPNSGLGKLTADMQDLGVNFQDERFNVDGQISATGFIGIKGHFKWVQESFERNNEKTEYERLTMTKFYGYVDLDQFMAELDAAQGSKSDQLEGVTPELFAAFKELIQIECMDGAKSHTELMAWAKKQPDIASNAALMNAIKDRAFLESLGLAKSGTKYTYSS